MKIVPFLINKVIAPHGITDIGHSILENKSTNLFLTYGINFTFTNLIINPLYMHDFMNVYFYIFSIMHFRHDFPKIKIYQFEIPRYISISLLLILFTIIKPELIILYMAFIHVPNHYSLNNFHIKKKKILNIILYILSVLICTTLYYNNQELLNNINVINNLKSIIISHIMYQEKFILNNEKL